MRHGRTTFVFLTMVRRLSFSNGCLDLSAKLYWLCGLCTNYSSTFGSILSQRPAFFSLALLPMPMIYRHTDIWNGNDKRAHQFHLRPRGYSSPIGFSTVRAADAWALLERTTRLEPQSETTVPTYLQLVTVSSFCPFTLISPWVPLALLAISFVFSTLISIL